jgi:hypothetical protein
MTQGFPGYPAPSTQQNFAIPEPPHFVPPPAAQPAPFFTQQDPAYQAQQPPMTAQQAPPMPEPQTPEDTSGFFGSGVSISWDDRKGYVKGTPRGGQIISKKISNQTKLGTNEVLRWDNGEPRKQMELVLQTAERADPQDDGRRRMFIKGDLPRAAREAMKAVGATDLAVGGWFYAAWVSDKKATKVGFNDQKVFNAVYAPPGSPDPMAGRPPYQAAPAQPSAPAQYVPVSEQVAPTVVNGVPQPHATPEQFAAYAAAQQQLVAAQGIPADQQAAFAAWQAQQAAQPGGQTQNGTAPTPQPAAQATPSPAPSAAPWNPFA